jgi:5-methylcytosine-specific restriction endonuclease McrA
MKKPCRRCNPPQLVEARDWVAHQDAHKNTTRTRQTGYGSEFDRAKRKALESQGYRCQRCHRTKAVLKREDKVLHVHHLDGNPSNNAQHNLQVLCEDCHPRGGRYGPRADGM